ncbi:MAG: hypothetical protein ACOYOA_03895 [Saprospiraceae bacterium]
MKTNYLILFFCACTFSTFCQSEKISISHKSNGITLKIDGNDFMVNGINWDYFPIGTNYSYNLWDKKDSEIKIALDSEMSLLKNMGVNAIRVYTGIPKKWIEYIYSSYGIYTMLNHSFGRYGLSIKGKFISQTAYGDADVRRILLGEVKSMVLDYKDTKGLLLFLLGNENNYGLVWEGAETENIPQNTKKLTKQARSLYKLMNEAALTMKKTDHSHPIAICNGDLQYLDIIAKECKDVDILGLNVYRGYSFDDVFQRVKKEYGKPVLFTEFGSDAYNSVTKKEDQLAQAEILKANWKEIYQNAAGLGKSENCIGGFTFQFSDGWWKFAQTKNLDVHDTHASWVNGGYSSDFVKGQNNMNEEWFGVCAKGPADGKGFYTLTPRAAYYTLQKVHQFNPYENGNNLVEIDRYFGSINTAGAMLKINNKEEIKNLKQDKITAKDILGNSGYQAICYGGYRAKSRNIEPTVAQIKDDLRILAAMNIKVLRTYNVHHEEISNLLKAIREMKAQDANFEMYVMLGAWIDCKNAFSPQTPDHNEESTRNEVEVAEAVRLTNEYPDIIKIIAVGNEAMVKWAQSYYVQPWIILKWVNHLQKLKKEQKLPAEVWITSSDNFASWGGGDSEYHVKELNQLIQSVDYISMHTYPMHDTHYNPSFWGTTADEDKLTEEEKIQAAMTRARDYAIGQYESVSRYMKSLGVNKPIHVGETGWASTCDGFYSNSGSRACDEYKSGIYYKLMREWSNKNGISLFYFEAFDEQWKDSNNELGSENHFGLISLKSEAKFVIWDLVDQEILKGLTREGKPITKTYDGKKDVLLKDVLPPTRFIKK